MDRLEAMTLFVAVVETGGFLSAARKMEVSPPVVTRAVAALESALGVRLLNRTTRQVHVTDVGARYVIDCRRVLNDIYEIEGMASRSHAFIAGRIIVAAPAAFGRMHLMPIVLNYLKTHPDTEIECRFSDRIVNTTDEDIDIAICTGPIPDSHHHTTVIGKVKQIVCASPAYLDKFGTPSLPKELQDHVVVSSQLTVSPTEWQFVRGNTSTFIRVEPRLTVTSNDDAILAAVDGFGITRVPSYTVAPYIADGRLIEILEKHDNNFLPVYAAYDGRHLPRRVRAFLDMIASEN